MAHSSHRQQLFREALSRESAKQKKNVDRGERFRSKFPYGVLVLWIAFFGILGYILLFSPFLVLSQITVISSGRVGAEEVQSVINPLLDTKRWFVFPARNFFVVPKTKITESLLTEYPLLESVRVERTFPNALEVITTERSKLLLWCSGGPCAMLDADERARVHEKSFQSRYDELRLSVVDTSALPFDIRAILPVREYLTYFSLLQGRFPEAAGIDLSLQATTPSRFSRELRVTTSEGWFLLVNIDIPFEETISSLQAFFEERRSQVSRPALISIDARVPGRIFFTEVNSGESENDKAVLSDTEVLDETKKQELLKENTKDTKKKKER